MSSFDVLLATGVLLMTPILLAALGEIIAERSGVLNLSIEGVMLCGCFAAAGVRQLDGSLTLAVLAAVPAGALLGGLLSYVFVRRRVSQIVGGILFNLLALGVTTLLFASSFDGSSEGAVVGAVGLPLLSDLPLVGAPLFDQPLLVYVAIGLAPVLAVILGRTWFGLHLRAAGERPEALDTAGVSVGGVRTGALVVGCALTGLAGGSLVALQAGAFSPGMTEGQGFIALAIAMLARWRPLLAVPAAACFGLTQALQFHAQAVGLEGLPPQFAAMLPYVATIVVIAVGRAAHYPAAVGVPYIRGDVR